ncbi:unnamed protein product [Brassica oleracea]
MVEKTTKTKMETFLEIVLLKCRSMGSRSTISACSGFFELGFLRQ